MAIHLRTGPSMYAEPKRFPKPPKKIREGYQKLRDIEKSERRDEKYHLSVETPGFEETVNDDEYFKILAKQLLDGHRTHSLKLQALNVSLQEAIAELEMNPMVARPALTALFEHVKFDNAFLLQIQAHKQRLDQDHKDFLDTSYDQYHSLKDYIRDFRYEAEQSGENFSHKEKKTLTIKAKLTKWIEKDSILNNQYYDLLERFTYLTQ